MSRPVAYLGNDTLLTMTKFGRKIYVDGRDLSIAPHILMQGDWEAWITSFMQRSLLRRGDDPGAFVLDVGANVGWYSLVAFFAKEHHYKALAFEPNPRLAELLRKTFAVNGLPTDWIYEKAVGDVAETLSICWMPEDFGGGRVKPRPAPNPVGPSDSPGCTLVAQIRLDDVIHPGSRVSMIKIDVEGHEPQVLRGAERIINENPTIELLVEHHAYPEETEVLLHLMAKGFALSYIGTDCNAHPIAIEEAEKLPNAEMLYLKRR